MAGAAVLLAILDAVIISGTPNTTRIVFALVVTVVVGYAILMIWRSNTRLEKTAAGLEKGGSKPDPGVSGKKR
jgi:hypothetical protein